MNHPIQPGQTWRHRLGFSSILIEEVSGYSVWFKIPGHEMAHVLSPTILYADYELAEEAP